MAALPGSGLPGTLGEAEPALGGDPTPVLSVNLDPAVRGIADTARWVALYRATESERPDALFRDPWARILAGERGERVVREMPESARRAGWSFVARTVTFDRIIQAQVAAGVSQVINLAAGLDTRPYRLDLPGTLRWIEVDQPELLSEKTALLSQAKPRCVLERVPLDLASESSRRELFRRWGALGLRTLIVSEGLLVYLSEAQVRALALDLAEQSSFERWATDVSSPGLLRMIQRDWGRVLAAGGALLQFAPERGPAFFADLGWAPEEVHPMIMTAARLGRLPPMLRFMTMLFPGAGRFNPRRPWGGVCLLRRTAAAPG